MVWWIIVLSLVTLYVAGALRWGPGRALAWIIPITWLLPAWLMLPVANGAPNSIVGSGLDIKVTVGSVCLILYCFIPGRRFPIQLIPSDFAMLGLVVVHLIIDTMHDGFTWVTPGRAYAEWYLPYVTGRLALQSRDDLKSIWWPFVAIGVGLAALAILEAISSINLFEWVFGQRPLEGYRHDSIRWGIRRAYGPTMHPIYLGVLLLLLLGWAAFSCILALKRKTSPYWVFAILPVIGGITATGSRGPILGVAIAGIAILFFLSTKARPPIGILVVALFGLAVVFHEPIISKLEQWSGEKQWKIEIDGESQLTSSVRSRVNLFEVNRIAIKRSGLFGFGTESVSGFPINVPLGPVEARTLQSVRAIDNTYILLMLRFGYMGVGFFTLAALLSVGQFFWLTQRYRRENIGWLCAGLGAVTFATLLVQCTVWMPHEIGFPLVWTFGLSAGILVSHWEDRL